jgi:dTDP-glucose 4,6-dehydratase
MSKTVLLTGIGGSIGCHFFAHIMETTDWKVVGIDSFRHKGWTDRVTYLCSQNPEWKARLKMITHDLVAPFSPLLMQKIGRVDYIINMASLSDVFDSIENPVPFMRNNIDLVINMLEYARVVKPEVFIQISTDEVYGPTDGVHRVTEWSPIVPSNPYSASKAAQEAIAISYWRTYNVPLIITNTMNNFGEMQQDSKFPVIAQRKLEKGEVITIHGREGYIGSRSYLHSRNFADAVVFILNNCQPHIHNPGTVDKPDRYNIAGNVQLDNLELCQFIADIIGKELKYEFESPESSRPGHDMHYGLDNTKLESKGWTAPMSFEESLRATIEWQKNHPEWIE